MRRGSEALRGALVASWRDVTESAAASTRTRTLSAWVAPEARLPGVGAHPSTRQAGFAECTSAGPVPRARVAVFTLVTRAETTAYLAAVWPLSSGRHLQLIATAPSAADLAPVRRALLDARTEPPAR